jgi:hypothetical protein
MAVEAAKPPGLGTALLTAIDRALSVDSTDQAPPADPPPPEPQQPPHRISEVEEACAGIKLPPGVTVRGAEAEMTERLGRRPEPREVKRYLALRYGPTAQPELTKARQRLAQAEADRLDALAAVDAAGEVHSEWDTLLETRDAMRQRMVYGQAQREQLERIAQQTEVYVNNNVHGSIEQAELLVALEGKMTSARSAIVRLDRWLAAMKDTLAEQDRAIQTFAKQHNVPLHDL